MGTKSIFANCYLFAIFVQCLWINGQKLIEDEPSGYDGPYRTGQKEKV